MSSFLGRVATTQHPTLPKKGVTIGDGDADYNGGDERPFLQAIADGAKHLEVIAGNFNFKTAVALAGNDISISCRGGVRFTPTPSGAVGLFDFTGDRIRVRGLTVDVPGFVPSQNVLQFSGQDVWIEDNTFTCLDAVASGFNGTPGPAAGHASNEMKLIGMTNCNAKRVIKNTFFPNKGVTCVQSFGSGLTNAPGSGIFAHNIARSLSRAYLPAFTDCWRVFDLFGDEYSIIQGNCIFQLGNAVNCDSVIFIRGHLTPAVESGHILIQGNAADR